MDGTADTDPTVEVSQIVSTPFYNIPWNMHMRSLCFTSGGFNSIYVADWPIIVRVVSP